MPITTTSILAPQVQIEFDKRILATPFAEYIHRMGADEYSLGANNGDTKRLTRYDEIDSALAPLESTGVTPPADLLTGVNIDAKIDYYGTWIELNEQVTLQRSDRVLNNAAIQLGNTLRKTEDELTRNMFQATAAVLNCVAGVNGDTPTELTASDVDDVVTLLRGANAKMFTKDIEGKDKFGTAPIAASYMVMAHTDLIKSMRNVQGFVHRSQYPDRSSIMQAEEGNIGDLRFMISSIGSKELGASKLNANLYNMFCSAKNSVGRIKQDQYGSRFIVHPPRLNGPMELNSTAAFKMSFVARILNDRHVYNLRCTI